MSKEFQIRDGNLIASFNLENEDGDIDFCKLLKVSHGVADEIGMFVDYVATNKIIKDQSNKISNLEAKLAEKEKAVEYLQEINQSLGQTCNNDAKEIERLRELIAEKEKEIANLKGLVRERDKQIKNLKTNKKRVIEHKNKAKINFAIEQLEKVKELCKKKFDWWKNSEWEGDIYDKSDVSNAYFDIEANIDNQIRQLKEEK